MRLTGAFFATDGTEVIQPADARYVELPIVGALPSV